jgi:hypothetical protein
MYKFTSQCISYNIAFYQIYPTLLSPCLYSWRSYNVPWDPVNADRWYIPEADRLSTVGQLLDRVAERERDWWSRYVDMWVYIDRRID